MVKSGLLLTTHAHKILKNNIPVTIRPIKRSDASFRHAFFVELSLWQTGMVHTADEIDYHVVESQEKIDDFLKNQRGLWLIALDDNARFIGEVDILVKKLKRVQHVGQLSIGVLKNFNNLGLGSFLMEEAIGWAKREGLLRLELTVFKSNINAQNLYKKYGFNIEGTRQKYLRHKDGRFEDDLLMALLL